MIHSIPERLPLINYLKSQFENPNQNNYYMALSCSRTQQATPEALDLLIHFVNNEKECQSQSPGTRWLEIVRRLSQNNYNLVFQKCIHSFSTIRVLLAESHNFANNQQLAILQAKIFAFQHQFKDKIPPQAAQIVLDTYKIFINIWTNLVNRQQHLLQNLNSQEALPIRLIKQFLKQFNQKLSELTIEPNKQSEKSILLNIECIKQLLTLFVQEQRKALNSLKLFTFRRQYENLTNLILEIQLHLIAMMVQIHSRSIKMDSIKLQLAECLNIATKTSLCAQAFINHSEVISQFLFGYLIDQFSFFQQSQEFNRSVNLGDIEQFLCAEQDMYQANQSQTIVCQLSKLYKSLANNVDGFLLNFSLKIIAYLSSPQKDRSGQVFVLLNILHKPLKQRSQITQKIIQIVHQKKLRQISFSIEFLINHNFQFLEEISFCRILSFIQKFNEPLCKSSLDFSQNFKMLLGFFISDRHKMLKKQAKITLQSMLDDNNSNRQIVQNIDQISASFYVVFEFCFVNNVISSSCLDILRQYFIKFRPIIRKNTVKWIKLICKNIILQIEQCWQKNQKNSPLIYSQIELLNIILEQMQSCPEFIEDSYFGQAPYFEAQEAIQPILKLLQKPQRNEINEQILETINILLKIAGTMTSTLCSAISSVYRFFCHNQNLLSPIRKIIVTISCKSKIKQEVLYTYTDLAKLFTQVIVDFLNTTVTLDHIQTCGRSVSQELYEDLLTIQAFLQNYQQFLKQNTECFNKIVKSLLSLYQKIVSNTLLDSYFKHWQCGKYCNTQMLMCQDNSKRISNSSKMENEEQTSNTNQKQQQKTVKLYSLTLQSTMQLILVMNNIKLIDGFFNLSRQQIILQMLSVFKSTLFQWSLDPCYTIKLFISSCINEVLAPLTYSSQVEKGSRFSEKRMFRVLNLYNMKRETQSSKFNKTRKITTLQTSLPYRSWRMDELVLQFLRCCKNSGWIDSFELMHFKTQIR